MWKSQFQEVPSRRNLCADCHPARQWRSIKRLPFAQHYSGFGSAVAGQTELAQQLPFPSAEHSLGPMAQLEPPQRKVP